MNQEIINWLLWLGVAVVGVAVLWLLRYKVGRLLLAFIKSPVTYIRYRLRLGKLKVRGHRRTHGFILGKTKRSRRFVSLPEKAEFMIGVFGGPGSNKTAGVLVPSLIHWGGSALVIDISGDISRPVVAARTRRGKSYPHAIIEPDGDSRGAKFDVLRSVDAAALDIGLQNVRLEQLAFALIPNVPTTSDAGKYYLNGSRVMLQASLVAFYHAGLDFPEICRQILKSSAEFLIEDITASGNEYAIDLITRSEDINEKTLAGIKEEVDNTVSLFATNKNIAAAIGRGGVAPDDLQEKSVFLSIPDSMLEVYAPFLRLFIAQTLHSLSARENKAKPPLLLALDEFSSLGRIDILPPLKKLRKKNVKICLITQSLADLELIYGNAESRAILDCLNYKAVLLCSEPDSQKYFSELAGYYYDEDGRRIRNIEPVDFGLLDKDMILFNPKGYMNLRKHNHYKGFRAFISRLSSRSTGRK
jgi:type IV secretory pathway TraG/TraD family ATPase VirD4